MSKKILPWLVIGFGVLVALFFISSSSPRSSETTANSQRAEPSSGEVVNAEKIEVVHFHATRQCQSCITVGKYAEKTVKERFAKEYAEGTIVFRDINGELPENTDLVTKYKAVGSSLFTNAITSDGIETIQEDTTVWRLIANEDQYMDYFETKLKKMLGK